MLGEESPGRQNWPRIQGPIDNYGLEWGRVLEPLKQNFTVDPEDSSSESSEPFMSSPSDSSLGGSADGVHPAAIESSDDVGNHSWLEEDDGDS